MPPLEGNWEVIYSWDNRRRSAKNNWVGSHRLNCSGCFLQILLWEFLKNSHDGTCDSDFKWALKKWWLFFCPLTIASLACKVLLPSFSNGLLCALLWGHWAQCCTVEVCCRPRGAERTWTWNQCTSQPWWGKGDELAWWWKTRLADVSFLPRLFLRACTITVRSCFSLLVSTMALCTGERLAVL